MAPTAWLSAWRRTASRPRRCTATRARTRAPRRWRSSRLAKCGRWWPPISLRAVSTSTNCVHRIGRTGRAGETGEAISLVCREEYDEWRGIEKLLKRSIPAFEVEGYTPRPKSEQTPAEDERPRGPRDGRHRGGGRPEQRTQSQGRRNSGNGQARSDGGRTAGQPQQQPRHPGAARSGQGAGRPQQRSSSGGRGRR